MKRATTAYHEAGHAVAALVMGFDVEHATIKREGNSAGHVKYRGMGRTRRISRERIESDIVVTLAGDIAQRRFAPRSSRSWQTTGDRANAVDLAFSVCSSGKSATAYLAWLHVVASELVEARWAQVTQVAVALLERETLSGAALQELLIGSPNDWQHLLRRQAA